MADQKAINEKLEKTRRKVEKLCVAVIVELFLKSHPDSFRKLNEIDDGINEICIKIDENLYQRIRVQVDYLPYNPLDVIVDEGHDYGETESGESSGEAD